MRTNVFNHWGTAHENSHVEAISGHVTRPYRIGDSNRGSKKRLISEIQTLIFFSPKNPARPQEIKATVMDESVIALEGRQRIFSRTLNLESVHVKQSAAPGLIDYPGGQPGL